MGHLNYSVDAIWSIALVQRILMLSFSSGDTEMKRTSYHDQLSPLTATAFAGFAQTQFTLDESTQTRYRPREPDRPRIRSSAQPIPEPPAPEQPPLGPLPRSPAPFA